MSEKFCFPPYGKHEGKSSRRGDHYDESLMFISTKSPNSK